MGCVVRVAGCIFRSNVIRVETFKTPSRESLEEKLQALCNMIQSATMSHPPNRHDKKNYKPYATLLSNVTRREITS